MTWRRVLLGLLFIGAVVALWRLAGRTCWSARLRYGVRVDECPAGRMIPELTLEARGLRRGSPGLVRLTPVAVYTTGWSRGVQTVTIRRGGATLALQTGSSTVALTPKDGWSRDAGGTLVGRVTLPADLPDGRHRLVARLKTPLGLAEARAPLEVFAPAKILVLTDRPLYEPGNLVRYRAVVLRARDHVPLDGRPGAWSIRAPDGTRVLEEEAAAGSYGVVAGDFPLDTTAAFGPWTVEWRSGEDAGETTFRVEPFELPRFSIEASAVRPHYGVGQQPVLRGRVKYASGAPVPGAAVAIAWRVTGDWPPPQMWHQGGLPERTVADAQGRFELRLPRVPNDLTGQATVVASLSAVDATGDRVSSIASVLLSRDDIRVSAVTELADGLVEGFNNRLYLRATTAAGAVLRDKTLRVTRAWDPSDPGQTVATDIDGVAALQIDPGPAVTVVAPGPVVRPPLPPPPVTLMSLYDYLRPDALSLDDQIVIDRADLAGCARYATDESETRTVLWVSAQGRVEDVAAGDGMLAGCAASKLRALKFGPGHARLLRAHHRFFWAGPRLSLAFDGSGPPPDAWVTRMRALAVEAVRCLPTTVTDRLIGRVLTWSIDARGRVRLRAVETPAPGARQPAEVTECVVSTLLAGREQPLTALGYEPPFKPTMGVVRARVIPAPERQTEPREDLTYLGYELRVEAFAGDERVGETKVRLRPGRIPRLRLRATPVVAEPGETVEVKVLRGPDFAGELPDELVLVNEGHRLEAKLDPKTRTARFTLPAGRVGWYEVGLDEAKAVVFVPDARRLSVDVSSDRPAYRPGDLAKISVHTTVQGRPAAAMVGVFGVDQSLAQLAPLPGPGVWSRLLALPTMSAPAFGALDAVALASGRVRGRAARAATVLRVSRVPEPENLDRAVHLSVGRTFDPVVPLTDTFYELLSRLAERVRQWDAEAPNGAQMRPELMAKLWDEVRADAPEAFRTDPFGRAMRLRILPDDLLALVDPRAVVTNGTRLPEDVDNWIRWVRRNRP